MNAANEEAVFAFLQGAISYNKIYETVKLNYDKFPLTHPKTILIYKINRSGSPLQPFLPLRPRRQYALFSKSPRKERSPFLPQLLRLYYRL